MKWQRLDLSLSDPSLGARVQGSVCNAPCRACRHRVLEGVTGQGSTLERGRLEIHER